MKALFGFDAIVGNYASPYTPGTAYVLLHHAFGEVNGKKRAWGHAIGGMGAITQAMARAAASSGVEIDDRCPGTRGSDREGQGGGRRAGGRRDHPRQGGRCQRQSQASLYRDGPARARSRPPFFAACAHGAAAPARSA